MKKEEFERLEECLYEESLRFLDEFSKMQDNEDVYVFAFDCDDSVGQVLAKIETESEFQKKLNADYPRYADLYDFVGGGIDGPGGFKYDESHFTYWNQLGNEELNHLLDKYYFEMVEQEIAEAEREFHYQQFNQVMVNVIHRLQPFIQLNKTDKFIAYYVLHDIDVETKVSLMKKTIPVEQLKKVFPNYYF